MTKQIRKTNKSTNSKHLFFFGGGKAEGDQTMRDLLGGKGAGLAEMTSAGLPVPPGFTISTEVCTLFYKGGNKVPISVEKEMKTHLGKLENLIDAALGSSEKPLLVSVRSGLSFLCQG